MRRAPRAWGWIAFALLLAARTPGRAAAADPPTRSVALYGQALLAAAAGDDAAAERFLRRSKELDPGSATIRFTLAETLLRRESWDAVERECQELLEQGTADRAAVLHLRAVAQVKRGDLDAAESSYRAAIAAGPQELEYYGELAQLLFERGRVLEAVGVLETAADAAPDDVGLWVRIAEAYWTLARGRLQEAPEESRELGRKAIAAFERAASLGRAMIDEAHYWLAIADVSALVGDVRRAIEGYEKLLELRPNLQEVREKLAESYRVAGEPQKAIAQLRILRDREPLNKEYPFQLAGLHWQVGEREEAVAACRESLAIDPKQPPVQLALAEFLRLLGRIDEAQGVLEQARSLSPDNPQIAWMLGLCLLQRGRAAEARAMWETCLDLAGRQTPPIALPGLFYYQYGAALEQLRDWPAAAAAYRKAVEGDPANLDFRRRLIVALEESGAGEEAGAALDEATRAEGARPLAGLLLRAQVALDRRRYGEAADAFDEALLRAAEEGPAPAGEELADLLFMAGAAHERSGRFERSVELLERSLALAPKNAEVLNYLGYMWAERGERLDEARALIDRALELSPDNGAYLDSLGWVFYQKGDLDKALPLLLRAAALVGDDPVVLDHLGRVYWDLGQRGLAVEQWRRALELDPDNEEIRRRLAESEESTQATEH